MARWSAGLAVMAAALTIGLFASESPALAAAPGPSATAEGGWHGQRYATSWDLYQAMKAAAHGGTAMTWAKLPDWTGVWTEAPRPSEVFDPTDQTGHSSAPLTPAYQALYDKKLAGIAKGVEWDNLSYCLPAGFPRWLSEPFLREFIVRPELVLWIEEQQNEIRHLYADGRGHMPEDEAYPLWEGDSIAFWDGDTLVAHTNHLMAGQYQRGQPDHSDQVSTVERIRKVAPDRIEDQLWVYDPPSLTRPWALTLSYVKVDTPGLRLNHWSCEENRNMARTADGGSRIILPGEPGYQAPYALPGQPK